MIIEITTKKIIKPFQKRKYLFILILIPTIIFDLCYWYFFNHNYFSKINLNNVFIGSKEHLKYLPNVPHNSFFPMLLTLAINIIFIVLVGYLFIKLNKISSRKTINKFLLVLSIKLIIIFLIQYISWYFIICKYPIGDIESQVVSYVNTFQVIKIFMVSYYIPLFILLFKNQDKIRI